MLVLRHETVLDTDMHVLAAMLGQMTRTLGMVPTTRMLWGGFLRCQMLLMAMERMQTVRGPMARTTTSFLRRGAPSCKCSGSWMRCMPKLGLLETSPRVCQVAGSVAAGPN